MGATPPHRGKASQPRPLHGFPQTAFLMFLLPGWAEPNGKAEAKRRGQAGSWGGSVPQGVWVTSPVVQHGSRGSSSSQGWRFIDLGICRLGGQLRACSQGRAPVFS